MNENQFNDLIARWSFDEQDGDTTDNAITKQKDAVHYVFHDALVLLGVLMKKMAM